MSENTDTTGESQRVHLRLKGDALAKIDAYAEEHNLNRSRAVEQLTEIATGTEDVGAKVASIEHTLDTVLEELNSPGRPAPVEEGGVVSDGAVTEKLNLDAFEWDTTEELTLDERDYTRTNVVKQKPSTRVPVLRALLLGEYGIGADLTRQQIKETAEEAFGVSKRTARSYVEAGMGRSWWFNPAQELEETNLRDEMVSYLRGQGIRVDPPKSVSAWCDLRIDDDALGRVRAWNPEEKVVLEDTRAPAMYIQQLSRLSQLIKNRPEDMAYQLLYQRLAEHAVDNSVLTEKQVTEHRGELLEGLPEDAHLPPARWWE